MTLEWYQRVLAGQDSHLGANHPDTQITIRNLEDSYQACNMLEEAEELRLQFPTAWLESETDSEE